MIGDFMILLGKLSVINLIAYRFTILKSDKLYSKPNFTASRLQLCRDEPASVNPITTVVGAIN